MSEILEIANAESGEPRAELTQPEMDALLPANPDFGRLPAARFFSQTSFVAIVEAVRNRLLDWSLSVEDNGDRHARTGPKESPVTRTRPPCSPVQRWRR
jgi:hypothetical protein